MIILPHRSVKSGSLSGNNSKRYSSSDDNPPSSKRQKAENGGPSEKPKPVAENSKEVSTPKLVADPGECDAQIVGDGTGDGLTSGKGDAGRLSRWRCQSVMLVVDKPRGSLSSWNIYQKQSPSSET
ncbi:hypothetical protein K1719_014046 [Acacia pycnantha]|nr:hypothetical protein K1719_014046 [Acacia pycnantha]